ncbi:helix-turn-helix domain-containing protein [uncultured Paludibaculum sp.]|uniref:helix-turn-helix domain-containing protein n=1 Tax=uncultured Paludibaculum sp. TaxID=1765020 RepID=UPI002AAC3AE2|nr:helix-turn-helix domain-containing protein [uncultured Paludibaculum sp.]
MTTNTSTPGEAERWLSVEEIAAYLGVKRDTIYKWIDRASLPAHKAGRLWKFRRAEVDDWVRKQRQGAPGSRLKEDDSKDSRPATE